MVADRESLLDVFDFRIMKKISKEFRGGVWEACSLALSTGQPRLV